MRKMLSDDLELFKECMQKFEEDEAKQREKRENQEAISRLLEDVIVTQSRV